MTTQTVTLPTPTSAAPTVPTCAFCNVAAATVVYRNGFDGGALIGFCDRCDPKAATR